MDKQKLNISLQSIIHQGGGILTVDKHYIGDYMIKNQSHYIRYHDEDSGLTTLKYDFSTKVVTLLWQQHATKKMMFSEVMETSMSYQLPQQQLHLTIKTKKINCILKDNTIKKLVIHYDLKDENQLFGRYKMRFTLIQSEN